MEQHLPRRNTAEALSIRIGSTEKTGGYAETRAIHYRDVLATIYHNLGIAPHESVRDINERPVTILPDTAQPIKELIG